MKEIKFRAWQKQVKEMVYFDVDPVVSNTELATGDAWGMFIKASTPVYLGAYREVMQFAGLRDKNKKECYEEDVVLAYRRDDVDKEHPHKLKVSFLNGCFMVGTCTVHEFYRLYQQDFEKIGNSFENPELLAR